GYSSNAFGGGYYFAGAMDGSFLINGTLNANNISLMFTPGIYFDQNPSNVNALLNTAQSISCHATGTGDVTYKWQKYNGSAWANLITQKGRSINFANIAYSDSGRYRCIATSSTVKDTCTEALISVTAPASVQDQALVKVNVSPNPFNDKIALAGLPNTTQVALRDLSSRIVFTTEVSGSEVVLNMPENIISGVYYLQLSAAGEVYTTKLLKK
ncbi:MAG: T9SS type A sorting domain-containing protein, partial [Bacteroidia bacterium]|nr:T9SS type A sorting domain-containing protein [Bacteroidia bacterium]